MSKRNLWVLPMDVKYKILGITYSDAMDFCQCQNCWRPITNIANIQDSNWREFYVGLDCAETLESSEIDNYREFTKQKKEYQAFKTLLSKVNWILKNKAKYTCTVRNSVYNETKEKWCTIDISYQKEEPRYSWRFLMSTWFSDITTRRIDKKYKELANKIIMDKLSYNIETTK